MKTNKGFIGLTTILVILSILILIGIIAYQTFHKLPASAGVQDVTIYDTPANSGQPLPSVGANSQLYKNDEYNLAMIIPSDVSISSGFDKDTLTFPASTFSVYFISGRPFQLTSEANLSLYKPQGACSTSQGSRVIDEADIRAGNVVFKKQSWSDVGAGQLYKGVDYTTIKGGLCYRVSLFTHSANGAGLFTNDQAEIKRIEDENKMEMQNLFSTSDQIVSTFKFTK